VTGSDRSIRQKSQCYAHCRHSSLSSLPACWRPWIIYICEQQSFSVDAVRSLTSLNNEYLNTTEHTEITTSTVNTANTPSRNENKYSEDVEPTSVIVGLYRSTHFKDTSSLLVACNADWLIGKSNVDSGHTHTPRTRPPTTMTTHGRPVAPNRVPRSLSGFRAGIRWHLQAIAYKSSNLFQSDLGLLFWETCTGFQSINASNINCAIVMHQIHIHCSVRTTCEISLHQPQPVRREVGFVQPVVYPTENMFPHKVRWTRPQVLRTWCLELTIPVCNQALTLIVLSVNSKLIYSWKHFNRIIVLTVFTKRLVCNVRWSIV